jgi:hypothetical protein
LTIKHLSSSANKYDVAPLVERCSAFVLKNISAENTFEMLTLARKHGYETIGKKCFETACEHAEEAVKAQGFYGIDLDTLCDFVRQDELVIDEYDLFKAVVAYLLFKFLN